MRRSTRLSTRILLSQMVILLITMAVGFGLYVRYTSDQLDAHYQQRALVLAESVAVMPEVRAAVAADRDPQGVVRDLAQQARLRTGASYVVVITREGTRLSHPNPLLIGLPVEEPVVALDGRTHTGVDPGSLGQSANGKAPVFAPDGRTVVGEVSAGILEEQVAGELRHELPALALYTALALLFGAAVSLLLARQLKRITFGLELHELAALLQEREAMLHGVREGVVTFDVGGRITLVNDEARRLLGLHTSALGSRIDDLLPPGRLRDVLSGRVGGPDQVVLTESHCLLANRMLVGQAGRPLGAVVTVRDRTEIENLLRELTSARGLSDALRAQQHEFSNRMHTVVGLLSLGEPDEALRYLTDTTEAVEGFAESVRARIHSPVLAALIVAKSTVAAERGVTLLVTDDSVVHAELPDTAAVVTIVGNLVDNAVDAAVLGPHPAHVTLRVRDDVHPADHAADHPDADGPAGDGSGDGADPPLGGLLIRVSDTGPGIPPAHGRSIFREGFSTKSSRGTVRRGLGLALVNKIVQRLGGEITVSKGAGPVFTVTLPPAPSHPHAEADLEPGPDESGTADGTHPIPESPSGAMS